MTRLAVCGTTALVAMLAAGCGSGGPTSPGPPHPPLISNVLVGAGDIAVCGSPGTEGTAALLDAIPGTVFTAGDNAYDRGSATDFERCYEPTWGRHKARTRPAPGNHDYETAGAAPYFAYFGPNAGPPGLGYYSFAVAEWHVISLNSNIPAGVGSPQYQWLRGDLEQNRSLCTAAIWHHPTFSSGQNGPDPMMQDAWRLLHQFGADLVITGHEHLYERFAPLDSFGRPVPADRGTREIIVGTGGASLYRFMRVSPGSEVRLAMWGVLKLTLQPTSYEWEFLTLGGTVSDSGRDACR